MCREGFMVELTLSDEKQQCTWRGRKNKWLDCGKAGRKVKGREQITKAIYRPHKEFGFYSNYYRKPLIGVKPGSSKMKSD